MPSDNEKNRREVESYLAAANKWKRLNPDNHNGFPSFAQWMEQQGKRAA